MTRRKNTPPKRRGRPPKNLVVSEFENAANVRVAVKIGGKTRTMTMREADAEKLWSDALNRDLKSLIEVCRREMELEPPLANGGEDDLVLGPLVVHPSLTFEQYDAIYGGPQEQPTLPILEAFRAELGLEPSNLHLRTKD